MDRTVTGMFPNQSAASLATANLEAAGFRTDQISVVDANTVGRHRFIDAATSDAKRAVMLGTVFGGIVGSLAGVLIAPASSMVLAALFGGLAAAIGGALLGLAIGRSTKSQVQDEVEHQVDAGTVLVSVTTDEEGAASALRVLDKEGASSIVSTAASFTAAVLPTTQSR